MDMSSHFKGKQLHEMAGHYKEIPNLLRARRLFLLQGKYELPVFHANDQGMWAYNGQRSLDAARRRKTIAISTKL